MVAKGESIPVLDRRVQWPEGLRVREKTAWFMEFFVGYLYRMIPFLNIPFDVYMRLFIPFFSSLSVLALFLLAKEVWRNNAAALISTLFYAVSLPAVARNTGFAFLKEHFALPFIFFHLYFFLSGLRKRGMYRIILSGIFLFLALGAWHFTQFYFGLLAVFILIGLIRGKRLSGNDIDHVPELMRNFGILVGFAFLGGLIIPYLRASFFILSYPMLLSYSLLSIWVLKKYGRLPGKNIFLCSLLAFLLLVVLTSFFSPRVRVYSHVYSLIFYKLRFLGRKPADPALLPFEARFYWYPDWTSPNLRYALTGFSALFLMGLFPMGSMVKKLLKGKIEFAGKFLLYFTLIFFILYLFLQRMEVFLSFFLAIFSGGLIFLGRRRVFKRLILILILFVFLGQMATTANQGPVFSSYDLGQLISWIRNNTGKDEVILSSISPSMAVLTYSGRPVVIHSFLESPDIRKKIKEFAEAIVSEGEGKLYSFCRKYGVNYLIVPRGIYTDDGLYSTRYITDHLKFDARAIGYRLEVPGESKRFNFKYGGKTYRGRMETTSSLRKPGKFALVFANEEYKVYKVKMSEGKGIQKE